MIITRAPFRMSFFGGGTDYKGFIDKHGGSVISTTFDKYCIVTVRHLPPFFDYRNQITYGKIERTNTADEIEHPAVRNAMKMLDMHDLRVVYEADLPARSGLASSSAFACALLMGFHALKGKYVDKKKLAEEAIYLERVLCNESGGYQDQIACAYGGLNRIDFLPGGDFNVSPIIISPERKKDLCDHLMLFFTGFSRISANIAQAQVKAEDEKERELLEMLSLVDEGERVLTSKTDINEFGKLLDYTWRLKRGLTSLISNDAIDDMYERAKKAGAIGGKLLGAGGGGFFLVYAEPERQEDIIKALPDLLHVPFEFENGGTRVFYYSPEVWEPHDEDLFLSKRNKEANA